MNNNIITMFINAMIATMIVQLDKKVLRQKVKLSNIVIKYDFSEFFHYFMLTLKHNSYHIQI